MSATKVGRSRATAGKGYLGVVPAAAWVVLGRAWQAPFRLKSNYAREHCHEVAFLASLGWITSIAIDGTQIMSSWHITKEGCQALEGSAITDIDERNKP